MQPSKETQAFITALAAQHDFDRTTPGQSLRLEMEGHLTLIIQVIAANRISIGQYYETKAEVLIPFLEILLFTGEAEWILLEFVAFTRHIYARLDAAGEQLFSVCTDRDSLVNYVEAWTTELTEQGWLTAAPATEESETEDDHASR
jgi:hypothetical protein